MIVLSIISTDETLGKVIDSELVGVEHEFIVVKQWDHGLEKATGKFVCFMEHNADFRGGMFIRGLLDILIKPGYSKLAMISPAVEELETGRMIFSYSIDPSGQTLETHTEPKSLEPYMARVGYIPGAIIRKSALEGWWGQMRSARAWPLQLSADFSTHLWNHGLRLHVDPKMVYQIDRVNDARRIGQMVPNEKALEVWKRESV